MSPASGRSSRVASCSGRLAQLAEHLLYTQGVGGSNPSPPTYESPAQRGFCFRAGDAEGRGQHDVQLFGRGSSSAERDRRLGRMMLAGVPVDPTATAALADIVRAAGADDLADRLDRARGVGPQKGPKGDTR